MENCVMCEEPITNPLCPGCIQEGMQQWLFEQGQDELAHRLRELTRNVFANNGNTHCIKCDSLMRLCTYCYSGQVFTLIKEQPKLVEQYLTYFNFDLDHQGWEQEARKYVTEVD